MKKRLISLFLAFAMLIPLTPAVAADETSAGPTVEEILSQYHQAAFEAEMNGQASTSTYSRSGSSGQTLEQQTVDTLNEAGYEAYNVTVDNYDMLEEQLQTDFADMGLDPNGSYIIVIEGEEDQTNNGNARLGDLILPPHEWDPGDAPGGDNTFVYTYNGTNYMMRYMTVTATTESELFRSFSYTLTSEQFPETWNEILFAGLAYITDTVFVVPIASIFSLLVDINTDSEFELLDTEDIKILGNTTWTLQYIQIYNSNENVWVSAHSSETAESRAYCTGYLYNTSSNRAERYVGNESVFSTYSADYNNTNKRKNDAVIAYLNGNGTAILRDVTGDIDFYLMDETYEFNYCGEGNPLFTQPHWNI